MAKTTCDQTGASYDEYWGWDIWTGTADQLIAAGLVRRCQLPGEPGNKKTRVTLVNGEPVEKGSFNPKNETYLIISRMSKHRYEVKKGIIESEKNRRNALRVERDNRENEERAQQAKIEGKVGVCEFLVENMHRSADSYRQYFLYHFDVSIERDGYRFDVATEIKMRSHIDAIMSLAKNGKIIFDPDLRADEICKIYLRDGLEPPIQKKQRPQIRLVK